jgi:hypothetical protein
MPLFFPKTRLAGQLYLSVLSSNFQRDIFLIPATVSMKMTIETFNLVIDRVSWRNIQSHLQVTFCLMYGSETWSLTLREEYRLRVYENRVLRRIFGPKKDEMK